MVLQLAYYKKTQEIERWWQCQIAEKLNN